jgi:hypothetical protein
MVLSSITLYLGATLAYVKNGMFRGTEVADFVTILILNTRFRHRVDGYSYVP